MKKLIFVYGTLKKNHGNNRVMGDSKFLGTHTTEPKFTLYGGGFPFVKSSGETPITGEVYEVTDKETLRDIYGLEGYSGVRGAKSNWYDTTDTETEFGTAELFVIHETPSGRPQIESGVWER